MHKFIVSSMFYYLTKIDCIHFVSNLSAEPLPPSIRLYYSFVLDLPHSFLPPYHFLDSAVHDIDWAVETGIFLYNPPPLVGFVGETFFREILHRKTKPKFRQHFELRENCKTQLRGNSIFPGPGPPPPSRKALKQSHFSLQADRMGGAASQPPPPIRNLH